MGLDGSVWSNTNSLGRLTRFVLILLRALYGSLLSEVEVLWSSVRYDRSDCFFMVTSKIEKWESLEDVFNYFYPMGRRLIFFMASLGGEEGQLGWIFQVMAFNPLYPYLLSSFPSLLHPSPLLPFTHLPSNPFLCLPLSFPPSHLAYPTLCQVWLN